MSFALLINHKTISLVTRDNTNTIWIIGNKTKCVNRTFQIQTTSALSSSSSSSSKEGVSLYQENRRRNNSLIMLDSRDLEEVFAIAGLL